MRIRHGPATVLGSVLFLRRTGTLMNVTGAERPWEGEGVPP